MASLKRSTNTSPREVLREWIDPDGGYDFRLVGFDGERPQGARLEEAKALIATACQPIDRGTLVEELSKTVAACAGRTRERFEWKAYVTVVGEELAEFPADVVRAALRRIRRRETWLPSLAEVIDECQRLARRRRALKRWVEGA